MDLLDQDVRSVQLGPHEKARYEADHRWTRLTSSDGRRWRPVDVLTTIEVLRALAGVTAELERAGNIVAVFGDHLPAPVAATV
jgi:hypothetical protein